MTLPPHIAAPFAPAPSTGRAILERRLGRPLGPLATMPRDLRRALYRLCLRLQRGGRA